MPKYKRILLKLSGEALAGENGFGIDRERISEIAAEIAAAARGGVQFGLVVGGGNFFRGIQASQTGIERVSVDYMGMLATVINAIALQDFLKARQLKARVLSAISVEPVAETFTRRAALGYLGSGEVVVFAAGTGCPYFSTDTAASLRAIEIEADVFAKATKVDGVYDKDPVKHSDARRYDKISYADVLTDGLAVMDAAAVSLCRENRMPVVVFNLNTPGNIGRLAAGETIGTLIS
jgi:uridylate kinase